MSKFDEAMDTYRAQLGAIMGDYDDALLTSVAQGLGPSIYLADASLVSCSDDEEKQRVKTNFLIGKLGLEDNGDLDGYIETVCQQMGSSNRNKYRAVFYYLLTVGTAMEHKIGN
jgi:hypothetical protein